MINVFENLDLNTGNMLNDSFRFLRLAGIEIKNK